MYQHKSLDLFGHAKWKTRIDWGILCYTKIMSVSGVVIKERPDWPMRSHRPISALLNHTSLTRKIESMGLFKIVLASGLLSPVSKSKRQHQERSQKSKSQGRIKAKLAWKMGLLVQLLWHKLIRISSRWARGQTSNHKVSENPPYVLGIDPWDVWWQNWRESP